MQFLEPIITMLTDRLGPLGPVIAVAGIGILLMLAVLPSFLRQKADPLDKLRATARGAAQRAASDGKQQALRVGSGGGDKLKKFASFLEPQSEEEMSDARLQMTRAGYRGKNAVRTFHAIQFGLGLGMLALGVAFALFAAQGGEVSTTKMILYVLLPGGAGYYLPKYWVERRVQTRQQDIQDGFPDALDLLLVCVEAGQSLDQGIIRVSKELQAGYPALAEEFGLVAHEIKAGKDKSQVLRAFGERSGVQDVNSFVTVMIQSQTFGTSIAEALRVYAGDMRDKRVMRAEEAANKIPTKMTLGTMMFTVPPLLIILVGPSVNDMMKTFASLNM